MDNTNTTNPKNFIDKIEYDTENFDRASTITSFEEDQKLPDKHAKVTRHVSTTATPYWPFPSIMKAFYRK